MSLVYKDMNKVVQEFGLHDNRKAKSQLANLYQPVKRDKG